MDITISIDTEKSISAVDRAILRAMLDDSAPPAPAPAVHRPAGASITDQVIASVAQGRGGVRASAKLPYSQQPGVTSTESVREDPPAAD